ncbi:unnamed protein product, partial [marine sediment metagenome]
RFLLAEVFSVAAVASYGPLDVMPTLRLATRVPG